MRDLFLDTGYVVALISKNDQHRQRAKELSAEVRRARPAIVTTQAVVLEITNSLAAVRHRATAATYVEMLRAEPFVEIVSLSDALLERGFTLYRERPDKSWGLTDCVSFVVMRERGLRDALSADRDCEQAGFHALLRPS